MSRARYVDATIPRDLATDLEATTDDIALERDIPKSDNEGLSDTFTADLGTFPAPSFTQAENLSDTFSASISGAAVAPSLTDAARPTDSISIQIIGADDGTELVALTEEIKFNRILGPVDLLSLPDLADAALSHPICAMSRLTDGTFTYSGTTGGGTQSAFGYDIGWRDIINTFDVSVPQREIVGIKDVWTSEAIYTIPIGQTLEIRAVAEGNNPFKDAITPVEGVRTYTTEDQTVSPSAYDFLVDRGSVVVTLSRNSGQSTIIKIRNTDPSNIAVVNGIRLRATSVEVAQTVRTEQDDLESREVNGIKTWDQELTWANFNDTRAIGEIILNQRFKRLPVAHFSIDNGNPVRLRTLLEIKLSDLIHIRETETFTNNDFYVEQVEHTVEQAGNVHRTMVGCEQVPVALSGAFTFNQAGLGFDDGVFGDRTNLYNFADNLFILGVDVLGSNGKVLGL